MAEAEPKPADYVDAAEGILRKYAAQNPNLGVWRVKVMTRDVIVVGMPDESNPSVPSDLVVLSTHLEGGVARIEFLASDLESRRSVPFGGGWDPLEELEKLAHLLSTI